jgi:hypothetical protein
MRRALLYCRSILRESRATLSCPPCCRTWPRRPTAAPGVSPPCDDYQNAVRPSCRGDICRLRERRIGLEIGLVRSYSSTSKEELNRFRQRSTRCTMPPACAPTAACGSGRACGFPPARHPRPSKSAKAAPVPLAMQMPLRSRPDKSILHACLETGKTTSSSERLTSTALGSKATPSGGANLKLWKPPPIPACARSAR